MDYHFSKEKTEKFFDYVFNVMKTDDKMVMMPATPLRTDDVDIINLLPDINICNYCSNGSGKCSNMIQMSDKDGYKDSSFMYCQECYEKHPDKILCEKCHINIQGFVCTGNKEFKFICWKCKCNDKECEYCDNSIDLPEEKVLKPVSPVRYIPMIPVNHEPCKYWSECIYCNPRSNKN